ncbi:MAG: DUF429 domain-containing protein [Brockia lithotrophica]|nr:DUF429 domain-containing protein [Brockia lithotrophica]
MNGSESGTPARLLGLDLAGSPRRPTGYAFCSGGAVRAGILYADAEIEELAADFDRIYVDAPLSLPSGRKDVEDRSGPHFRTCDRMLRERGIRFFPVTLGPMRRLAERGMRFAETWRKRGKEVWEVYPGAVYDIFGLPRKSREEIAAFFRRRGFLLPERAGGPLTQDELDAVAALWMGILHLRGETELLAGEDGAIVLPRRGAKGVMGCP